MEGKKGKRRKWNNRCDLNQQGSKNFINREHEEGVENEGVMRV